MFPSSVPPIQVAVTGIGLTSGPIVRTVGRMHLELSELEAGLDEIRRSPLDDGKVELIVRRPAENEREALREGRLDTAAGLVGDAWLDEDGDRERQLTVMNARVVALLAAAPDRWALAGDQLYVDLDLSGENLPPGTRLQVGSAIIEVSGEPHRGCKKFAARFGLDALRFVNSKQGYALNLRGINTRVVRGGVVRPGDVVHKC
jgi:MOSC domain-containing protein YiiM